MPSFVFYLAQVPERTTENIMAFSIQNLMACMKVFSLPL